MDENKSGLYIVAIVGIIAVVALTIMIIGIGTEKTKLSSTTEDTAGQVAALIEIEGGTQSCSTNCDDGSSCNITGNIACRCDCKTLTYYTSTGKQADCKCQS